MPRLTLPRLLVAAGLFAFVALAPALRAADAPTRTLIQATDLLKLKQLEAPALSPDGKWIVYVVRSIEPKPDLPAEASAKVGAKDDWRYHTNLWLAPADGRSAPRQLTRGTSATAPAWSPQGDRIAFVRAAEKEKPQIHVLPVAGGEATPITKIETGASAPRWSPDGTKILFTSTLTYAQARAALEQAAQDAKPTWNVERPGRHVNDVANWGARKPAAQENAATADADPASAKEKMPKADPDGSLPERREWLARNEAESNPRPLARLNFLSESDINAEQTFAHLFVQEAREGAEARDLTPGFVGYSGAEWMRDGQAIVCAAAADATQHPDRVLTSGLFLVDAAGGGVREFLKLPDNSVVAPQPSPDGKWVAFTVTRGQLFSYEQSAIGVVATSGGEPKILTRAQDRSATNLQWSADSSAIYYVVADRGRFPLCRVTLASGNFEVLTPEAGWGVRDFALDRATLAQVVTHPGNPSELHVADVNAKASKPISQHNATWIDARQLSTIEEHALTNDQGQPVQYWTLKPTALEAGRKYPLLLQIHGGPAAMWGPGEESMWFEFQYFAARGYAIVFANPRGSGGYGKEFQRANYRDWGAGPAADVLAAASEAAKLPFVDATRQVITGGSYGGYLTAWIVGHDHRFKAAVAQRGVYDLLTFFGEGNAWRLVPLAWGGYPWEPGLREILIEQSPLTYVAQIKTPLLIQHGDNDRRTGFVQSEMLLKSLKVLGRDVESVRYPRATHEMSRSGEPKQRLDSLVRYEEFFRRYIGEN
jgi:dipeptidyl aminopeptidase/acylaminoacyl peptidase